MRTVRSSFPLATALAVLLLASPVWAQKMVKPAKADLDQPPDIYRLQIYNGPNRTVHYVSSSYMSPSDSASLRELEKAENEMALVDLLSDLRVAYARNELAMEAKRHSMQMLLYGYNRSESSTYAAGASGPATLGWGGGAGGILPGFGGMYGWMGNGYYGGYYGQMAASGNTQHSLAVGMGVNEGAIKEALVQNLTSPALTEQAALAYRNYQSALARIDDNARLRGGMGLPDAAAPRVAPAATTTSDMLQLKDGGKLEGKIVKEDADWIYIQTGDKRTEQVRKSEVTRISRTGAVKPASNNKE